MLSAIVIVSARFGIMKLMKIAVLFHLNERVFHVWQYQVHRFRPRYLCRYSPHLLPCCGGSHNAHTDGTHGKPRTRIDKTKTRRSVLLSAIRTRPAPRPVPSYRRGGAFFFHHLIVPSRIPSASSHLVSFPVSDDSGARGVSSRSPSSASFRIVSSHQMRASKTTGHEALGFASSFYYIIHAAGVPSSSRSSSRASRVVERLDPCRRGVSCVSSDEGQASKQASKQDDWAGRGVLGFSSRRPAPSSVRRACHPRFS